MIFDSFDGVPSCFPTGSREKPDRTIKRGQCVVKLQAQSIALSQEFVSCIFALFGRCA